MDQTNAETKEEPKSDNDAQQQTIELEASFEVDECVSSRESPSPKSIRVSISADVRSEGDHLDLDLHADGNMIEDSNPDPTGKTVSDSALSFDVTDGTHIVVRSLNGKNCNDELKKGETGPDPNSICMDSQDKTNGANSDVQSDLKGNDHGFNSDHRSSDKNNVLTDESNNDLNSKKSTDLKDRISSWMDETRAKEPSESSTNKNCEGETDDRLDEDKNDEILVRVTSDNERETNKESWWKFMRVLRKASDCNDNDAVIDESGDVTDVMPEKESEKGVANWWKRNVSTFGETNGDDEKKQKKGPQRSLASFMVPSDILEAVDILNNTINNFQNHGIVDVMKMYPRWTVFQAAYVLAKLQKAWHIQVKRRRIETDGTNQKKQSIEYLIQKTSRLPSKDLLRDLAHYSSYATAIYGWKVLAMLTGTIYGSDMAALLGKTGLDPVDIVSVRWDSEPHKPAYFLARDHENQSIVLSIRGTITMKDVLTDLFFEEDSALQEEDDYDALLAKMGAGQKATLEDKDNTCPNSVRAHQGMVHSAREIARETRLEVEALLSTNEGYRLVLLGHSMGGGAAAIIGSFWRNVFPRVVVYIFGSPCVSPLNSLPTNSDIVFSVLREGDPFSALSIGHVSDISKQIAMLCEDQTLRNEALSKVQNRNVVDLSSTDLSWCCEQISELRRKYNTRKHYPAGQLYYISGRNNQEKISRVEPEHFGEMLIHKNMTDISRHYFTNYEKVLKRFYDKIEDLEPNPIIFGRKIG